MSLQVVDKWVQKNRQSESVDWERYLGYVEVFPLSNNSRTHLYHHFLGSWTSQKWHFRRESFPTLLTSDVPKSTHCEPVRMLRRLPWWWTSHMRCMQLLWPVFCHLLPHNASFGASNTSQCHKWAHFDGTSPQVCFFKKCSQNPGKHIFSKLFFSKFTNLLGMRVHSMVTVRGTANHLGSMFKGYLFRKNT